MNRIFTKIIAAVFSAILTVVSMSAIFSTAYAADSEKKEYSFVSDDLGKDSSFDASYYPEKADDYSLSVIQLAESEDKELFVYVYQPSGEEKNLRATSINISTSSEIDISPINYPLEYLNSTGTLFKYIVKNFTVSSDPVRYYAIPSIFRTLDKDLGDKEAENNNTISEVPYEVAKQWCFSKINGKPYVSVVDIETIVITDKFVGFVRYPNGFRFFGDGGACDSHFVAFNTDKNIEKLFEADVYYTTQDVSYMLFQNGSFSNPNYGTSKLDNYAFLKYTDKVEYIGSGLNARTYKWDRIQTVDEFIKSENRSTIYCGAVFNVEISSVISDEALKKLENKKWVLRFSETKLTLEGKSGMGAVSYDLVSSTMVGDVTILRLKFETAGIVYNLGVIDNKQTGERDSDGLPKPIEPIESIIVEGEGCAAGIGKILAIMSGLLFFAILLPFVPMLIQCVTFIVSFPLKLINKKREQNATNNKPKMKKEGKK